MSKTKEQTNLSDFAADILAAVDASFDEQFDYTQELVRFPSVRGQEHTAQDFLFHDLRSRGYAMDRWAIDVASIENHPGFSPVTVDYTNAINVVATHRPREETGRSLILNGHIDVVPTGPLDMWDQPPFEPKIEGDWLYGRGAGDMKAGIVANIFALEALRKIGLQPAATVHMQSVTEEECTGNGALSALVRGYRADAALIPEPVNDSLVRANVGVIWFKVHVKGHPVHVADAGSGANAIDAAAFLIAELKKFEHHRNQKKKDHPHFADLERAINVNVGRIEGGDWASSVPAWCTFDVRREIEDFLRHASSGHSFLSNNPPDVTYNGFFAEGYELKEGSDAENVLATAHQSVTSRALESITSLAYLDARVFVLYDDTPCLVYGPLSDNIHGFNEKVSLKSVRDVTNTIALFVANWCGVEKI
jgi:acetylornithine deacetylase